MLERIGDQFIHNQSAGNRRVGIQTYPVRPHGDFYTPLVRPVGAPDVLREALQVVGHIEPCQIFRTVKTLMYERNGLYPVPALVEDLRDLGVTGSLYLKGQETVHNLEIVLDPVVNLPEQDLLLPA